MSKIKILSFLCFLIVFFGCEDCECLEEDTNPLPPETLCEGTFYSSRFISIDNGFDVDYFLDSFQQPIPTPFITSELEEQTINLPSFEPFPSNFSAYDKISDKYVFHYLYDDSPVRIFYIAETNPFSSEIVLVQEDYAAPVFLNGELYAINGLFDEPNLSFNILQINQSTGVGTSVFSNTVAIDGFYSNSFISSATNGIDTIYFLGVKTLIAYNVVAGTSQVFDIDIQYDPDIQTGLSGLEYRTETDQLIAIHHRLNSPDDINEVISINPENGNYESLFDLGDNIGANLDDGPIELLINSTTYSTCEDTYYITQLSTTETDPIENTILEINLENLNLTKRVTEDFIYGISIDETP